MCGVPVPFILFYFEWLITFWPITKLEDHILPAVHDCLFNIFAAIPPIYGRRLSIRNLRMHRAKVTGTYNAQNEVLREIFEVKRDEIIGEKILFCMFTVMYYRARWLRGNARDSHSGGPGFKSRGRPTWLRFLVVSSN